MTDKIFLSGATRCAEEQEAYDAAQDTAKSALKVLRAALIEQIGKELAECGIAIGSPVVARTGWDGRNTERGIVRGWDHNGVRVAKRNKDGSAHAIHDIWSVQSITLDTEALKGGAQ
jgi:hypothetical protein